MKLINYYTILSGGIRVETGNSYGLDIYPINVKTLNKISKNITWEIEMMPYMWAQSHAFTDECTVLITDKNGNILLERDIDNVVDGDTVQNYFDIWSSNKKGALGIVAGAHDGTSGEWVDMIIDKKLKAILFEPLNYAFNDLVKYYNDNTSVELINKAVTIDGGEIVFYAEQNCGGYCSTTLLEQAKNSPMSFDNFKEELIGSESVKNILEKYKPKWFHLDIEGLDYDIVSEIIKYDDLHPEIIVYEHHLISEDKRIELDQKLTSKGYVNLRGEKLNSIAIKNQPQPRPE